MRPALKIASRIQEQFIQKPISYGVCNLGRQQKTKYGTHKDGQAMIDIIALKNPVLAKDLHTYRCKKCNHIHLGHHDQLPALSGQRRKRLKQISHVWNMEFTPRKNRLKNSVAKMVVRLLFKDLADVLDRATLELARHEED